MLAAGVQQRLVRVADLMAEAKRNPRLHPRPLFLETLADIAGGASPIPRGWFST